MHRPIASSGWWLYDPSGIIVVTICSPLRMRSWHSEQRDGRGAA